MNFSVNRIASEPLQNRFGWQRHLAGQIVGKGPCAGDYRTLQGTSAARCGPACMAALHAARA